MSNVPDIRIQSCNGQSVIENNDYVVYWMIAFRRPFFNFALQRAIEHATKLDKELLVFEPLRLGYKWASDRFHQFIMDGMLFNLQYFSDKDVHYFPYVEEIKGDGKGLLKSLCERACVVVTDEWPSFFHPKMLDAASKQVECLMEKVDSNGLLPLRGADKVFKRAHDFRRHLQKNLSEHLQEMPLAEPLKDISLPTRKTLPAPVRGAWTAATADFLARSSRSIEKLDLDHSVGVVENSIGGWKEARKRADAFLEKRLRKYHEGRNHPDEVSASGLSPWLHFGFISAHEIFHDITEHESWEISDLGKPTGKREGWWGMSEAAEAFLDELVTWREVGFNMSFHEPEHYMEYESLPEWALTTLGEHEHDEREYIYSLDEFENAQTHDEVWNAAQRQLRREGIIHNYLRMLWGKKILHWSQSPKDALEIMIELNNKYALDGRDPNSYSGIFWTLGRYDRAWQERKIFGKVRYMTSDSTRKKLKMSEYLEKYGPDSVEQIS